MNSLSWTFPWKPSPILNTAQGFDQESGRDTGSAAARQVWPKQSRLLRRGAASGLGDPGLEGIVQGILW